MWRKLALLAGLVLCARAQNVVSDGTSGPWTAELNGTWRWHSGDDMQWSAASFDDSSWAHLTVPGTPPDTLRYWIRIPVEFGKVPDPGVMIGPLAYAYELYWDGERIGNLGRDSPHAQWFTPRSLVFSIPVHLTAPGHHVVAIRVLDGRRRGANIRQPELSTLDNRVGSISALNDTATAHWSKLVQRRSLTLLINLILVLTGAYFVLLPRSIAGSLAFCWFGACLLCQGIPTLLQYYEHLGPPVISAGILNRVGTSIFGLNFLFAIDFAYAIFQRQVPTAIRAIQVLNLAAILVFQIDPVFLYPELLAVAAITAVVISIIGVALAAAEFRRRSPGAGLMLALFGVWVYVNSSYFLNLVLHMPVPISIELSGFAVRVVSSPGDGYTVGLWDASLFLWIPIMAVEINRINQRSQGERDRLRGEMEAARRVQEILLPSRSIRTPGFDVDTSYEPATEVGGDFFQLFPASGDSLLVVVGDVSGKGMKAALLVSLIVGALRNRKSDLPSHVLSELNFALLAQSEAGFTTCCCALFAPDGTLTLANAGHLAPYRNGLEIETPPALPLGVDADTLWPEIRIAVQPSDRILWVSDGVVEARNGKGDLLGFERAQALATQSASDITRAAQQFGQEDDITVVSITRQAVRAHVA